MNRKSGGRNLRLRLPRTHLRRRPGPVAFVMSGGGPLGAVQAGLIKSLLAEGIVPDLTVGASVGALNALFVAEDPTLEGAERLCDIWIHMRKDDLFPGGRLVSTWNAVKRGSYVFSNHGLRRIIETNLDAADFEDLRIPAHVVAANLRSGGEVWFWKGPITEPLLASAAMPGIFPPVQIGEDSYIDGGVVNNVPVSRAVELGAKKIYVLNVSGATQTRTLARPHDFVMHGLVLARAQRYRMDVNLYRQRAAIVEFPVVEVGHVPFTSLARTSQLIDAGYEAGLQFLRGELSPTSETG